MGNLAIWQSGKEREAMRGSLPDCPIARLGRGLGAGHRVAGPLLDLAPHLPPANWAGRRLGPADWLRRVPLLRRGPGSLLVTPRPRPRYLRARPAGEPRLRRRIAEADDASGQRQIPAFALAPGA